MVINRAKLEANGIYVPLSGKASPSLPHHELAMEFIRGSRRRPPTVKLDELEAELKRAGYPGHILMSSEFFQGQLHNPAYVNLLRETLFSMGYRLQLIGYLRPQVPYINSFYSQQSKNLLNTLDIDEFISEALKTPHFNFRRLLLARRPVNGIDCNYRPFNLEVLQRGIVQDFLSALGLDEAAIATMEIPAAKNIRPGPKTVAACVDIARRMSDKGIVLDFANRTLASRAMLKLGDRLGWNKSGFSGITAAQAMRIRRRFAEGDAIFAERVWKRSWEDVFGADCWTPQPINVFDRQTASPQEASEFDDVIERTWRRVQDGKLEALVMEADLASTSLLSARRLVRRLRAFSADLRTRWYTET